MAEPRTYTARWIVPVSSGPLANGTITVEGAKIIAVEPKGSRTPDVDLGNVAVIPGLVNCHTHLDLSGARGKIPPTDPEHFTDWLKGVIAYRRSRTPEEVQADIREGLAECLRYGTTLVGDIAAGGASYTAVVASDIRAILFWEIIGLNESRYDEQLRQFGITCFSPWIRDDPPPPKPETEFCRWALSPHAPYSVNHAAMMAQLAMGNTAIHFAEVKDECDLLEHKSGSLVSFLNELGVWNPEAISLNHHDLLCSLPRAAPPRLLIHGNYLKTDMVIHATQSLIYCPRTHAAFGHPRHPFHEFQARGVRVALGTDSLASNPDLDLLAEARFVRAIRPEVPCGELLRMATLTGAEALGWADETGSLEAGKSADFVALSLANRDAADPHELIFGEDLPGAERRTMFRGEWRN